MSGFLSGPNVLLLKQGSFTGGCWPGRFLRLLIDCGTVDEYW